MEYLSFKKPFFVFSTRRSKLKNKEGNVKYQGKKYYHSRKERLLLKKVANVKLYDESNNLQAHVLQTERARDKWSIKFGNNLENLASMKDVSSISTHKRLSVTFFDHKLLIKHNWGSNEAQMFKINKNEEEMKIATLTIGSLNPSNHEIIPESASQVDERLVISTFYTFALVKARE
ncbi:hypothetical protein [Halobacillus campisalis]|uniref:Tubby C-terminal domain-containing protein n=1 Tax=Halobacillus campisalis TaxID=435909 RepID=A0ABW2JZS1_9BACI|nr:hypothetical protein [Halobacillus campisalis]